ncbi:MAG: class I SAM-dependent methyltransferase [bacterium]|nr:class I SAM-dependent methyltransferase [bacterium]
MTTAGLMNRVRAEWAERRHARRCARHHYGNAVAFIRTYYQRFQSELADRIADILDYDETHVPGMAGDQEEHALPGMQRYRSTGYHEYMLGRYLYAVQYLRGKRVLDSGCGLGWGSYLICDYAESLLSVDLSPEALRCCRDTWKDDRLAFRECSVLDLASLGQTFDTVLSFEVIEHLTFQQGEKYLGQMYECLDPGGVLVMSSAFPKSPERAARLVEDNVFHLHIFTAGELTEVARRCGFGRPSFLGDCLTVLRK